jgi:hypothetical protein
MPTKKFGPATWLVGWPVGQTQSVLVVPPVLFDVLYTFELLYVFWKYNMSENSDILVGIIVLSD